MLLIKTPTIKLLPQRAVIPPTDNIVVGTIVDIEKDHKDSETNVKLEDGLLLCSIMPNQEVEEQEIKISSKVTTIFSASQVIVATLQ